MDDALTPEELRLVELLRQGVSSSPGQKRSLNSHQPQRPLPEPALQKVRQETAQIVDAAELRQKAAEKFGEFKSRFSGLKDDDPAALYQELDGLVAQAVDLKKTLETYLRRKKADDARQAVSDMLSKGIFFQKIIIDDLQFNISKAGVISLVSDPDRIKLSF